MSEYNDKVAHDQKFAEAMAQQPKPSSEYKLRKTAENIGNPIEPSAVKGVNRAIGEKVFNELTKKK